MYQDMVAHVEVMFVHGRRQNRTVTLHGQDLRPGDEKINQANKKKHRK